MALSPQIEAAIAAVIDDRGNAEPFADAMRAMRDHNIPFTDDDIAWLAQRTFNMGRRSSKDSKGRTAGQRAKLKQFGFYNQLIADDVKPGDAIRETGIKFKLNKNQLKRLGEIIDGRDSKMNPILPVEQKTSGRNVPGILNDEDSAVPSKSET